MPDTQQIVSATPADPPSQRYGLVAPPVGFRVDRRLVEDRRLAEDRQVPSAEGQGSGPIAGAA
jgi:hypothetical protein